MIIWNENTLHADKTAILQSKVIHASIILLTFGSTLSNNESYDFLLQTWFPVNGNYEVQQAKTGEKIELLEPWLRMKIVQCNVERLVHAGNSFCLFGYFDTSFSTEVDINYDQISY